MSPSLPHTARGCLRRFHITARFATALLVAVAPGPAAAQDLAEACRALQAPVVGSWAQYRLTSAPRTDSTTLRMAIIAEEDLEGVLHVWQESVVDGPGGRTVIQSLVPASPYDPTTIRRAVLQLPGRQPAELPPSALAMMREAGGAQTPGLDACRQGQVVGPETVTVPAGTFRALRVRYVREERTADSWLVPTVPFALARSVVGGPDRVELVLLGYGRDATPTIPLPGLQRP